MLKNKIFILLLVFISLSSCEYSPVYKNINKEKIKIEIANIEGDELINFFIKSKLKVYSKSAGSLIYTINVSSNYQKKDISKDKTGKVVNYELSLRTVFDVSSNKIKDKIIFEENFSYKNNDNTYKNKETENLIKRDFADKVVEELASQLLYLQ